MAASCDGQSASNFHSTLHTTTELDPGERTAICRIYAAWRATGHKPADFEVVLVAAGYSIPRRTLNHWAHTITHPAKTPGPSRKRGRPAALQPEQADISIGHCLKLLEENKIVQLTTLREYVWDEFCVSLSPSMACRLFHEYGLGSRTVQLYSCGTGTKTSVLADTYANWIRTQRDAGFLTLPRSKIGSIDFTFTKHRTTRLKTYAVIGR